MKDKLPNGMKYSKDTEIFVNVVVEEGMDEFGRSYRKTMWKKLEEPLNLGSINNPREKIIQIKVTDNSKMDVSGIFKGMFG